MTVLNTSQVPDAPRVDPTGGEPVRREPARRRAPRRTANRVVLYVVLSLVALLIVLPLLWIVLTSFKTDGDAIRNPFSALPNPFSMDAYVTLASGQQPIFRWFLNSLLAATLQTAIILVTASAAAYALARLEFWGKKIVFGAIIATLLVPPVIFLIPNYLIVQNLGWLDTIWAISIPGAASAFGVFFLRQFFIGLPVEIEEAARIDGAGDLRIFLQIVIPLARPALATLAVLSFLANWNDFLWPVYVLLSPENLTLQPGLAQLQGAYSTHFAIVMAGAVIASIPVLILFSIAQRHIVDSVASSGVKG
jgi:multiple sugar transport system permease protein